MTATPLLRARIVSEQDVFAVRRQGRRAAAACGLSEQDQIRVAAALSEIGRRLLSTGTVVEVAIDLDESRRLRFRIAAPVGIDEETAGQLELTRALMDDWKLEREPQRTTVSMARKLPRRATTMSEAALDGIRSDLAGLTAGTAMEELAEHNRQLLATLADVEAHRDQLLQLNSELEQTNQGVVALYAELSGELEATNRGVVALYAELDQRNIEVRAASEAKTRFLGNVSHELRSPVTSIIGLTRLLRDPSSDPLTAEQSQQLDMIESSGMNLLNLVNELLDLAKAESGRLEPTIETVDLAAIFDTMRGTMRGLPRADATELVVEAPTDIPPIRTDPIMLQQVLRNLVSNGLKFTRNGEVRLSATLSAPGELVLAVTDTGIGIPTNELDRIFEEFHQVRNPLQASVTGTGLGLPYARRLTVLLGGELTVTSLPGSGSTFTVRLPVDFADDEPTGSVPISVLVIDDDPGFRTAACKILRDCGFTVYEAADGRDGISTAQVYRPDMVLLDLHLGDIDGFAVLDTMAADDRLAQIPVVVVTAYASELFGHAAAARSVAILDKTNTMLDDLCMVVRSTVAPRRLR
ncbi:MAG TPA: ATP-binding protein [Micromonosporaceae bacterium]|jgi:signal transduction histidine kinase